MSNLRPAGALAEAVYRSCCLLWAPDLWGRLTCGVRIFHWCCPATLQEWFLVAMRLEAAARQKSWYLGASRAQVCRFFALPQVSTFVRFARNIFKHVGVSLMFMTDWADCCCVSLQIKFVQIQALGLVGCYARYCSEVHGGFGERSGVSAGGVFWGSKNHKLDTK